MDGDPQTCVAAESDSITYFLHIRVAINKLTQMIISSQTEQLKISLLCSLILDSALPQQCRTPKIGS